jgi:hypothetical protein
MNSDVHPEEHHIITISTERIEVVLSILNNMAKARFLNRAMRALIANLIILFNYRILGYVFDPVVVHQFLLNVLGGDHNHSKQSIL